MSNDPGPVDPHTVAWGAQVWISWLVSCAMLAGGTLMLPADWWVKGYLVMGQLFVVGSTFSLAKTVRDNHEAAKMRNRITKAKADKLLKEYELNEA